MIKRLANSVTIGTSNTTVGNARVVRVINNSANAVLVVQSDPVTNTQVGSLVLSAGDRAILEKLRDHVLSSNNDGTVSGTSVTYGN
jgi:hypothetical protein